MAPPLVHAAPAGGLRRDLGILASYAALIGILIGAGIFRVTSDAWALTGPSVIAAHLVLAPLVLATSLPYAAFVSTSLGDLPGGEYTHLSRTFGGFRTAFVGAWLRIISYLGALAYLANAFADYVIAGSGGVLHAQHRVFLALGALAFFFGVHVAGARWFGRLQVAMCAVLGLSLIVLLVPGLPAVHAANYRPFFAGGVTGFAAALPPIFFAYAGFEALAQTAGEVKDSRRRLPQVFLLGIGATTLIYILMSVVTFGVLSGAALRHSTAPMADVAARYLPAGAAWFVTVGAVMALASSLNTTMLVPSRLAMMLAADGLAPRWFGAVNPRTGTPVGGLAATFMISALLLLSGQMGLALSIAVFALLILYFLHSFALVRLPRLNPGLAAEVRIRIPRRWQVVAAVASMFGMAILILVQIVTDVQAMATTTLVARITGHGRASLTSVELIVAWGALGALVFRLARTRKGAR